MTPDETLDLAAVEQRLGLRFRQPALLAQALTHKSFTHESPSGTAAHNESLEFLGDAVLGFLVTDHIYRQWPELDEGGQSKIKAHMVSTVTLARLAGQLGLPEHVRLGKGERKTGGRHKMALRANVLEAVVASVYLDAGIEAARELVRRIYEPDFRSIREGRAEVVDAKTRLQEYLQAHERPLAAYRVTAESGPEHKKTFHVELVLEGRRLAEGRGRTKKEAELRAAERALELLREDPAQPDDRSMNPPPRSRSPS